MTIPSRIPTCAAWLAAFEIADSVVVAVQSILNPDKLANLGPGRDGSDPATAVPPMTVAVPSRLKLGLPPQTEEAPGWPS